MSLNISDATNATSQQGIARPSAAAGVRFSKRSADQMPDAANATSTPKVPGGEPDDQLMRLNPTNAIDESLQRLHESAEPAKQKFRPRKSAAEEEDRPPDPQPPSTAPGQRCPYDPMPVRQRDVDLLV